MASKKRQRFRVEKGEEEKEEEEEEEDLSSKNKRADNNTDDANNEPDDEFIDPNDDGGTLHVARGGQPIDDDADDDILETMSESQKLQVGKHLWGNQGDLAVVRRQLLRQDDTNPSFKRLTETQKHHLKKRPHKKTNALLQQHETKRLQAAVSAVQAVEILQDNTAGRLEAETDMERTTAVTQTQLKRHHLNRNDAKQIYDLQLSAPYGLQYDRSGRYSILYGKTNGHVALMDCQRQCLVTEFRLDGDGERIRDATFLHNFTLTATAQRNHVYIYDQTGAEIHCLQDHSDPMKLQYLPYHWLLASIGRTGFLKYQDVSTGQLVSTHRTQLGAATALRQNPANAVLYAGHSNGTVTLWSPASSTYLAKLLCHRGAAVTSLAIDLEGRTMVTGGMDRQVRVWDLRMLQQRHAYYTVAGVPSTMDISQRGLLALGHAGHVTVWGADALIHKVAAPYMHHPLGPAGDNHAKGPVETVRFRPFEDVCGIGHANGVSSIVIPGSGEPALDTTEYALNPAQDTKQRRETEVRALLDKLSPDMISLDADTVGGMEASDPATRLERIQDLQEAANANKQQQQHSKKKEKTKKRGRSKIQTKLRRKHKNIIDQSTLRLREAREQEAAARQAARENEDTAAVQVETSKEKAPAALKRFF